VLFCLLTWLLYGRAQRPATGTVMAEFELAPGWVLVYTSFIMMVLRFFAGPIVHALSPLGLLMLSSAIAETSLTIEVDGTMVDGTGGFSILCVSEVSGAPGAITQLQDRGTYFDFLLSLARRA
jgi:hypothetical protein